MDVDRLEHARRSREHDMNANLLFMWRLLHQQGLLEPQRAEASTTLVAVKVESQHDAACI